MNFSEAQLNNKDFLQQIKTKANDYMLSDQATEAYHLAKDLEAALEKIKDFKNRYFDFFIRYKKIIHRLKWIGLPIMAESMVVEMFKYHFTEIFHIPDFPFTELRRKLKAFLLSIIIFKDRDEFKRNLRQALLNNQEKLTSKKLIINNQEKMPTVGNWVLDYNSNLGTGTVDNIKRIEYLTNGKNVKNLNQEEKNRLKFLFDLFEKIKLSSLTLEGVEEDIPVDDDNMKGIIKGGVFEPFKEGKIILQPARARTATAAKGGQPTNLEQLKQLAAEYPVGSFERKAVEEEISRITRNS